MEDGVIRLLSTLEQWQVFPSLLEHARNLGAEEIGFCKVLLPEGAPGRSLTKSLESTKQPGHCFSFRSEKNGAFTVDMIETEIDLVGESQGLERLSAKDLVKKFEELLQTSGLQDVRYCTDIEARSPASGDCLGLWNSLAVFPIGLLDHLERPLPCAEMTGEQLPLTI